MNRHAPNRRLWAALLFGVSCSSHATAWWRPTRSSSVHASGRRDRRGLAERDPGVLLRELADGSEMALVDGTGTTDRQRARSTRRSDPDADRSTGARAGRLRGPVEVVRRRRPPRDGHVHVHLRRRDHASAVRAPTPSSPVSRHRPGPRRRGSPAASASLAPSPTEGQPTPPADAASTNDVLLPIVAAVVLVALLGGYLLLRRRPSQP
jgi:hypothetical protein